MRKVSIGELTNVFFNIQLYLLQLGVGGHPAAFGDGLNPVNNQQRDMISISY